MEVKYSIWGAANKLKKESASSMEHSPFRGVYRKAERMLFSIVQNGKLMRRADRMSRLQT